MLDTSKETGCSYMARFRAAIDRSSILSAVGGAGGGGVIILFRVAEAFDRYRLTERKTRPMFKYYLEDICGIPTRFLNTNERSYQPHPIRLTIKKHLVYMYSHHIGTRSVQVLSLNKH